MLQIRNLVIGITLYTGSAHAIHLHGPQSRRVPGEIFTSSYSDHWEQLLFAEHRHNSEELKKKRKSWSRHRLEETGISIFGAVAEPDTELFGEKIIRIVKKGRETRFCDRFTRGDVLLLTPKVPAVEPIPRECLVVDVGQDWMSLGIGPSWLPRLWESRKLAGYYEVRLDRTVPQAPLKAQRRALDRLRKGQAGTAANVLAEIFQTSTGAPRLASISEHFADELSSAAPSYFNNTASLDDNIKEALNESKMITSFQPNQSQEEAVTWALKRQISLIRGPPGTGKTRVAALLVSTFMKLKILQAKTAGMREGNAVEHSGHGRVLAVTHSNGAADVLLEALLQMGVPAVRFGRPASVSSSVQHRTVVAMAERMPQVKKLRRAMSKASDDQGRSSAAYELRKGTLEIQKMITETAPVVVTSCIGASQLFQEGEDSSIERFSMVVLDEAAQTTEPALICALAAAEAEQLVMVGDTHQLPPTITCLDLRDSLGVSPMARLEEEGVGLFTLQTQYRMPPALLKHPSTYFYNGMVSCAQKEEEKNPKVSSPDGFPWPSPDKLPLAFVQVGDGDSEIQHNFGGRSNPKEAEVVASIVSRILAAGDVEASKVAVISPYSKQVQLIRNELTSTRNRLAGGVAGSSSQKGSVRVGTVDSFQGQETDLVIISAVRSNPLGELGFLRDSRRLCVAITRARRGLIVVGDRAVLQTCRHWAALLQSCDERKCSMTMRDLRGEAPLIPREEESFNFLDELKSFNDEDGDEFYGLFSTTAGLPSDNANQTNRI